MSVGGAVNRPGTQRLGDSKRSLLDAIWHAGGLVCGARFVALRTSGSEGDDSWEGWIEITLADLWKKRAILNVELAPGDHVALAEPAFFSIEGGVARPGRYPLGIDTTLHEALELAGASGAKVAQITHASAEGAPQDPPQSIELGSSGIDLAIQAGDRIAVEPRSWIQSVFGGPPS